MEDATTDKDRGRQKRFAFFSEVVVESMRTSSSLKPKGMNEDR